MPDRSTLPSHGVTAYKAGSRTGAAPVLIVWGGHFCPLPLTLILVLGLLQQIQIQNQSQKQRTGVSAPHKASAASLPSLPIETGVLSWDHPHYR